MILLFFFFTGQSQGEVVALATGDCTTDPNKLDHTGRTLIDCHGDVLAHRALYK